jgi:hypothetical protein
MRKKKMKSQRPLNVKIKNISKLGVITLEFDQKLELPPYIQRLYK